MKFSLRIKRTYTQMTRNLPALLFLATTLPALAQKPAAPIPNQPPVWVVSWSASQQIPEPQNALPADDLRDATLRQIFHLSLGGYGLRVHISNAFGIAPLHLTSVHIAHPLSPASPAIDPATDKPLTFAGHADVTIPPGAEILSDPSDTPVAPLSDLAVSIHYDVPPSVQTGHPGSRATSYYVHGDAASAPNLEAPKHIDHWYQVSAIDVLAPAPNAAIVALGDSITDGHGATTNGNDRWTDVLAARLQFSTRDPGPETLDLTRHRRRRTPASAAIICSPTDLAPTPSPASIAMSSPRPVSAGSSSSRASTISAA
jgi:hypothetical protein